MTKQATILKAYRDGNGYTWDFLEVRESKEHQEGFGVFATKPLKAGLMIPILGKIVNEKDFCDPDKTFSHGWIYSSTVPVWGIDGILRSVHTPMLDAMDLR